MKILAFAGSNSSVSINLKLLKIASSQLNDKDVQILNMADFPFPMYSEDLEKEKGFSNSLIELSNDIKSADALIIAVNEHNGNVSAYFKNVMDWLSRFNRSFMQDKKVLLLSTSPGKGGAKNALMLAGKMLPYFGAEVLASFSLPSFYQSVDIEKNTITDQAKNEELKTTLQSFLKQIEA